MKAGRLLAELPVVQPGPGAHVVAGALLQGGLSGSGRPGPPPAQREPRPAHDAGCCVPHDGLTALPPPHPRPTSPFGCKIRRTRLCSVPECDSLRREQVTDAVLHPRPEGRRGLEFGPPKELRLGRVRPAAPRADRHAQGLNRQWHS